MLDRILVSLDGSPSAERCLPLVVALANVFRSEVVLLRVVEGKGGRAQFVDPVGWRLARRGATSYLEGVRARLGQAHVDVDVDVGVGSPVEEVFETARARRADLVALTPHGAGGPSGVPLAGTAHKVVSGLETSILMVPAGEGDVPLDGLERILVPLDGSPRAEWAFCMAASLATGSGAALVLAHVVQSHAPPGGGSDPDLRTTAQRYLEAARQAAERYLDATARRLATPPTEVSRRVVVAPSVPGALSALAQEEGASLVVVSAHGESGRPEPFGTVARHLLEHPVVPLLVLQDRAALGGAAAATLRARETPRRPVPVG